MAIQRKKNTEHTEQGVLSSVFERVANALRAIVFGYDGSNYIAIKTDSNGVVKVCDINAVAAGGGAQYTAAASVSAGQRGTIAMGHDRASGRLRFARLGVSGALYTTGTTIAGATRVSADILQTLNSAASGLYIRYGTNAAKVSVIAGSTSATRVSADLLKTLNAAASGLYVRPGVGNAASGLYMRFGTNAAKVSVIQAANQKVSAIQVANNKTSSIFISKFNAASGMYVRFGTNAAKVSVIQLTNSKISAIYNAPHVVSAVERNMTLSASAAFNAAGSAAVIAASAGQTRRLSDIIISSYANDIRVSVKAGGRKLTPWMKLKDGSGLAHTFSFRPAAVAGSAVKISASAGSGQVVIHRF